MIDSAAHALDDSHTRTLGSVQAVKAIRVLYWILFALTISLLATGIYLVFNYRPVAVLAFSDASDLQGDRFGSAIRSIHVITPWLWFVTATVLVVSEFSKRSYRWGSLLGASLVSGGVAFVTGLMLPWDQVALWTVTVGSNMAGYAFLFSDDNVRFVLIDGREISTRTIQLWLFAHIYLGCATLAICALAAFRRGRTHEGH